MLCDNKTPGEERTKLFITYSLDIKITEWKKIVQV